MCKKIFFFVLAISFLSFYLLAEENQKSSVEKESDHSSLQYEIVVTATRLETPAKEIASSITVIKREDLERTKKSTVLEALQEVLGITVIQNGPLGSAASVLLRGANSEHTLVMLDGVELNDPMSPSRSCDLAHLTLNNIDRVEILRGPQSTLYGSDALSGVIHIITKKGHGKPTFHLSTQGGSYGTLFSNAEISGGTDKIHYSFGTSYSQTAGFSAASTFYEGNREKDGYKNLTFSGKWGFHPADHIDFDVLLRTIKTTIDIDNFGGAYGDDPNNKQEYDAFILKGQLRGIFLGNRWEQKLNISYVDYDRMYENPTDDSHPFDSDNSQFQSKQWKLDWQHNFFLHETNTLTFGLEYQEEQGQSEYHSESLWGPFSSVFSHQKAQNPGFYIQDQIRWADRFFATLGARIDHHSLAGTSITYRIAPAFLIEQTGTKFRVAFGTGFKSPSLYQLFAPGTTLGPIGNEDLEPEESSSWEGGIEQILLQNKLICNATYFSGRYENLIDFVSTQGYINILKASSKGAEFSLQAWPFDHLSLAASYTRTEAKDETKDEYLLRRPKNKFTAGMNFDFLKKAHVTLSLIHIGEREDMEWTGWASTRVTMPSYTLLNAALSYDVFPKAQIFLRLDNILDEEYELIKGYGTPGFSAFGGVKVLF